MRPSKHIPGKPDGFAIVVTVSILLLLAVVAIGLLSLSSVTIRSSQANSASEEARANARIGLIIAIGELQRSLGPDRRVSAPAAILDATPDTETVDDVEHPHWTAVWSTEWPDGSTPWSRDDDEGGLKDKRSDPAWMADNHLEHFLVSGNEGGRNRSDPSLWLDARTTILDPQEGVPLVDDGSVNNPGHKVTAKRVRLRDKPNQASTGSYAYWVGDLGVRANIARADAHRHQPIGNGAAGLQRILHAQDCSPAVLGQLGTVDDELAEQIISTQTLELLPDINTNGLQDHFHDITSYSRSTHTNVRNGGLQRDLTAYVSTRGNIPDLRSGDNVTSPGLRDSDSMAGPANTLRAGEEQLVWRKQRLKDIAPRFGLLRRWNELAEEKSFSVRSTEMMTPKALRDRNLLSALNDNVNVYDRAHMRPPAFLPLDSINLTPVLVEGSVYYNLATFPTTSNGRTLWTLRLCLYPRIVLWNPHNIELELPRTVAELFVNGNKQVRVDRSNGSKRDVIIPFGRGSVPEHRSPAHYRGTVLWTLPSITLAPGETLVFSADKAGKYDLNNIEQNSLSASHAPDPTRYYYQDMTRKHSQRPTRFIEFPKSGNDSGGDNYLMALKDGGNRRLTDVVFDNLPTIVYANTSLQAGGSDELPVLWNSAADVPVHLLSSANGILPVNATPDVRTRDGFRLRWWQEQNSNVLGSGRLRNHPRHLQSSAIANWNPRAAYFCRTPFDNVTNQPPYFYGIYTRDLFDGDVSWAALTPRTRGGKMLGFPFGPPLEGPDSIVLFEVPRKETGIPSLGYLRHLKVSEFGWHPSYAIGNSLADPRVGRTSTSPILSSSREKRDGGWNQYTLGWANGRGAQQDYWARLTRQIIFDSPRNNNVVHDQSFELNHTLWDNFFFSTGSASDKEDFLKFPRQDPLPNGRLCLFSADHTRPDDLTDFHRAASRIGIEGGFNVHSTSKDAWKAFLTATRDTGFGSEGNTPFPRLLDPPGSEWNGQDSSAPGVWNGFRSLSDDEIDRLATELVAEVKRRAPFFGLSDFVNRRLRDDPTGDMGPLQAAIEAAGLNHELNSRFPLDNKEKLPNYSFDNISNATRLDQTLKPATTAWGIPGHLTQGDILQVIGSSIRARSDSFLIRSYGEATDAAGTVLARAWCEAVVQRVPTPLNPDDHNLNPAPTSDSTPDFGRRFQLISFRWLSPNEV